MSGSIVTLSSADPVDTVPIVTRTVPLSRLPSSLFTLPRDIIVDCIAQNLCAMCIVRLSSTCRRLRGFLNNHPKIVKWSAIFKNSPSEKCLVYATLEGSQCIINLLKSTHTGEWRGDKKSYPQIWKDPRSDDKLRRQAVRFYQDAYEGNLAGVKIGVERFKDYTNSIVYAFEYACQQNQTHVLDFLINSHQLPLCNALSIVAQFGNAEILKLITKRIYELQLDPYILGSYDVYTKACRGGNIDIVKMIVDYRLQTGSKLLHNGYEEACYGGHIDVANYLNAVGNFGYEFIIAK